MAIVVADSDVLIDHLRGNPEAGQAIREAMTQGRLATTTITAFELLRGARSPEGKQVVDDLLAPLTILSFDVDAAEISAATLQELDAAGSPLAIQDCMIAGICLSRGATLLTRNRRHFDRIEGLRLAPSGPGVGHRE